MKKGKPIGLPFFVSEEVGFRASRRFIAELFTSNPTRKQNYSLTLFRFFRKKKNTEEVGFEPTVPAKELLFSRQAHSATLPLFQKLIC